MIEEKSGEVWLPGRILKSIPNISITKYYEIIIVLQGIC